MIVKQLKQVDDLHFVMCPPGLTPEFVLYDMEQDGTKRYIINLAPWGGEECTTSELTS